MAAAARMRPTNIMTRTRYVVIVAALLLVNASALAQVPWETPQLTAPHAPRGIALVAANYAVAPGDGWGAVLTWRHDVAPAGLGLRVVAGRGRGETAAIGAGVDASAWVARASKAFPMDVIAVSGIGASYGNFLQIALPVGIAAGRSFGDEVFWFSPYAATRLIIEGRVGGRAPADELDLQVANELGANLSFDRERRFVLRLAAALGDRSAFAMGAHISPAARPQTNAVRRR